MIIFKLCALFFSLSVLAQDNLIKDEEAYKTPKTEHDVMYQGGDSKFNRITKNELAIDYLKKEVAQLKAQVKMLSDELMKQKNATNQNQN